MAEASCILLTGGAGFVGRHLAPVLGARFAGARRVVLVQGPEASVTPGWESVAADLTDEAAVEAVVARLRPTMVVHLAAQSSVGQAAGMAEQTWRVNFGGSFALARALARQDAEGAFLFASSSEVYGTSFRRGRVDEETAPQPANAYGASKLAAEHMLRDMLPASVRLIIARAFNHSGPGQDERFVLPAFAAQVARIEAGLSPPRMLVGNLEAERDFLHVADVVEAYVRLLAASPDFERRTLVNIASGQARKIADLAGILRARATVPFEIVQDPGRLRPSEIVRAAGDAARIRALVGWEPEHTPEMLLEDLLGWWRAQVRPPGGALAQARQGGD